MKRYLCEARVLLKDFGAYASALSNRIRAAAHAFAAREHRPVRYLHSTALSKEELARTLAERNRVREGLIGLFDIVEPCLTYFVRGDRAAHQFHLELRPGKCLHHYFYCASRRESLEPREARRRDRHSLRSGFFTEVDTDEL